MYDVSEIKKVIERCDNKSDKLHIILYDFVEFDTTFLKFQKNHTTLLWFYLFLSDFESFLSKKDCLEFGQSHEHFERVALRREGEKKKNWKIPYAVLISESY